MRMATLTFRIPARLIRRAALHNPFVSTGEGQGRQYMFGGGPSGSRQCPTVTYRSGLIAGKMENP
jgi:hypothetical protein